MTSTLDVTEVVPGVHRMALPLGIHGVPTVSAYLLHGDDGDVLVDCGIAVRWDVSTAVRRNMGSALLVKTGRSHRPPRASPTRAGRWTRRCGRPGAGWSASPGWS